MGKVRILLIVFVVIGLNGCATGGYKQPTPNSDTATVYNTSKRTSAFNWESFVIQSIDNQFVSYTKENWLSLGGPAKGKRRYPPGRHTFVVRAAFNRYFGGPGPFEAFVEISANLKSHQVYRLNGEVDGATFVVWLEDRESGEVASEVVTAKYSTMPTNSTVPIFIPTNY